MPTAMPDIATTTAGTPITVAILANDTGGDLTLIGITNPTNGVVTIDNDQSIVYTPDLGFHGIDSFVYTIRDSLGATAQGEVTVTVVVPNDAPIASPDEVSLLEGEQVVVPVIANDSDPNGDPLQIVAVTMPAHGSIQILEDQSIRYTPQPGFIGIDGLNYTITDPGGLSAQTTVTFHVGSANQPPVAVEDNVTTHIDTAVLIDAVANDNDPDGPSPSLVAFTMPNAGTVTLDALQRFVYTPSSGFVGKDFFSYTIRDTNGAQAVGEVIVDVVELNQSPVAVDDIFETDFGTPVTLTPIANDNDPDGDTLRLTGLTFPAHGNVSLDATGNIIYTPDVGFSGSDQLTYNIDDGNGGTDVGTIEIIVLSPSTAYSHANGYSHRRRLVVASSAVSGESHAGFPLWVSLVGDWLRSAAHGGDVESVDGFDIRFELEDGSKLAHEIAHYDPVAGELGAWVRVPELLGDGSNVINLYYGKSGLTTSEADRATVWQDYLAVWHLPGTSDATAAGRDLTQIGTVNVEEGGLGEGAALFAGDASLRIDDTSWLAGHSALSVQLRSRADAVDHDHGMLHGGLFGNDADADFVLRYDDVGFGGGAPTNVVHAKLKTGAGNAGVASAADIQSTDWQNIALAWQSGESAALYVDGAVSQPSFDNAPSEPTTTAFSGPLYIGAGPYDGSSGGWHGAIDEVRLRAGRLDAGWIATEHANQNDPATFLGMGDADLGGSTEDSVVALPFRISIASGEHRDIDVLAAAHRAAGVDGVELLEVSQPSHGVASVVSGQLRYTSSAGHVGADRFTYTLRNGDKTSTATIAIDVQSALSGNLPAPLRTVTVANATDLTNALANALPGDHITLADGSYTGNFSTSTAGTASNPIILRAANKLGATIKGTINLDDDHNWIWGLDFDNGYARIRASHTKILRSKWRNTSRGSVALSHISGSDIEIGYTEFVDIAGRAIDGQPRNGARGAHIHHNYFHKWPSFQSSSEGGRMAGRYGASDAESDIDCAVVLEDNLFDNSEAGGKWPNEWAFEFKCSGNTIQRNTVKDVGASRGTIGIRHGENNIFRSNRYIGSGSGLYVADRNNKLIGNDLTACNHGIRIFAGQVDPTIVPYSGGGGIYPYALDTVAAYNKGQIIVGFQFSAQQTDPALKPARNTSIEAHSGNVDLRVYGGKPAHADTVQTSTSSRTNPGTAPTLTPQLVGPDA